jgi:hypothetical protein
VRTPSIKWIAVRQWTGYVTRGERVLAVVMTEQRRKWSVVAVETPRSAANQGADAVLDNHAHHMVAINVKTRREALKMLRAFLRQWAVLEPGVACECKDILP